MAEQSRESLLYTECLCVRFIFPSSRSVTRGRKIRSNFERRVAAHPMLARANDVEEHTHTISLSLSLSLSLFSPSLVIFRRINSPSSCHLLNVITDATVPFSDDVSSLQSGGKIDGGDTFLSNRETTFRN